VEVVVGRVVVVVVGRVVVVVVGCVVVVVVGCVVVVVVGGFCLKDIPSQKAGKPPIVGCHEVPPSVDRKMLFVELLP
jgi:hypothetical protein